MQGVLEVRNRSLLRDIRLLRDMLDDAWAPDELRPYRARIEGMCRDLESQAILNLAYLGLGKADILSDVLSTTALVTRNVRLLGARMTPPILRAAQSDRVSLAAIGWLHRSHPEMEDYPPAFSDGDVAVWPFLGFGAPLYFFPSVEQRGLLYQPLYFHEFGHVLYARHRPELDALVGELQRTVHGALVPASQRNDRHAAEQAARRQAAVDTWYQWAQELFCDAVGFTIGGPCFLRAFSTYLNHLVETDFYRRSDQLRMSPHPVTWLRVQFLARRAARAGFPNVAQAVTDEWRTVAATLRIREDYHGFYVQALEDSVERIIDDMLTEASPRPYTAVEAAGGGWSLTADTPVRLMNWAWQVYMDEPDAYAPWEANQIRMLVGA